jgi:hypothetical protein
MRWIMKMSPHRRSEATSNDISDGGIGRFLVKTIMQNRTSLSSVHSIMAATGTHAFRGGDRPLCLERTNAACFLFHTGEKLAILIMGFCTSRYWSSLLSFQSPMQPIQFRPDFRVLAKHFGNAPASWMGKRPFRKMRLFGSTIRTSHPLLPSLHFSSCTLAMWGRSWMMAALERGSSRPL